MKLKNILFILFVITFCNIKSQIARTIRIADEHVQNTFDTKDDSYLKDLYKIQSNPDLLRRGNRHFFEKNKLDAILYPVGGIGTGCILFDGKAVPRYWQIFNNMTYDYVPDNFFLIRTSQDDIVDVRALRTEDVGNVKGFSGLKCRNEFPFLSYYFDDELPVTVSMSVYSPFIPLNLKDSGIPVVFYKIKVRNRSGRTVDVDLLSSQQNAVGFSQVSTIYEGKSFAERFEICRNRNLVCNGRSGLYGGNYNYMKKVKGHPVLYMTSDRNESDEHFGQMALIGMNSGTDFSYTSKWSDLDRLADDFLSDGIVEEQDGGEPSADGITYNCALSSKVRLKKGESREFVFALAWFFPNGKNGGVNSHWDSWGNGKWIGDGNHYSSVWKSFDSLVEYLVSDNARLYNESEAFHESLFGTNIPYWLIERLSSQLSILRSRTIFHDKNGFVGLWEGCGSGDGSCSGNCTHVWHYAQAHARLFPELARTIREQSFSHIKEDGQIPYRLPSGSDSFDGQCGEILSVYREHLLSDSDGWLKGLYPEVRKSVYYLVNKWDKDKDGWLEGRMHTTYDCSVSGNSSFLSSLYLATLKSAVEMSRICGDSETEKELEELLLKGLKVQDERLWNGEYYIQVPDSLNPASDYNGGCHSDQLLGQWWADQLGLGNIFPEYRLKSAYNSIFRYNYRPSLKNHVQSPREFAMKDEPGIIVATWPKGDRPANSTAYSDEVWTTHEYTVSSGLIKYHNLVDAFTLLRSGASRYDGVLKSGYKGEWGNFGFSGNPFGDDECGQFYSRALSCWSVLLALQGFGYDGPKGYLSFEPVWLPHDHCSFFSTAEGWGNFYQQLDGERQSNRILLSDGHLNLRTLRLDNLSGNRNLEMKVFYDGKQINPEFEIGTDKIDFRFEGLKLDENKELKINIYEKK